MVKEMGIMFWVAGLGLLGSEFVGYNFNLVLKVAVQVWNFRMKHLGVYFCFF